MTVGMLLSASGDAPTYDEPAYIGTGIAYARIHDLRVNYEHPPLVKVLAGLPLRGARAEAPPRNPVFPHWTESYERGSQALYGQGSDPDHLLWLARLPMIALTLVFALAVFGFATDLFGVRGGLVALALVALCPNVIAHGRLVTTDVPVAGFSLVTVWLLWRARHRSIVWLAPAGIAYGLALSSKFTALVLAPVVAGLAVWAALAWRADRTRRARRIDAARWIAVVLSLAVGMVWLVYLSVDPSLRFGSPPVLPDELNGPVERIARALPLPRPYREGILLQIATDRNLGRSFLFGERTEGKHVAYYPLVLLIKTPLGTLVLWGIGIVALWEASQRWEQAAYLLLPPVVVLIAALNTHRNIGLRNTLVVPLFLAVAAGGLVRLRFRARPAVIGTMLAATAASMWAVHPSYLAYANEAFGGPSRAHRILADSDVDWGQDLRRLATYLREHPHPGETQILYFGTARPSAYGIAARDIGDMPEALRPGVLAASASAINLLGYESLVEGREPIAQVGHSILIYRIE